MGLPTLGDDFVVECFAQGFLTAFGMTKML